MNETIFINKKNEEILKEIPGDNVSQKVAYLINQYAAIQGDRE